MADDTGEKTEAPTPRRREESRNKGQIARSQDLNGIVIVLGGLITLKIIGGRMWLEMKARVRRYLADDPDQQMKLLVAGFKHLWGRPEGGIDAGDEAQFKTAFGAEGFDADVLWALGNDPETKAILRANTEEAVERGAFGAPTFFVGDEMFFGHDRLDYAEEALLA